jgi:hypothetical protein
MCGIRKSGVLALAFVGFCAGSARAADVTVKVPFAFVAGRETLPAGVYVVERVGEDPSVMLLKGTGLNDKAAAIVMGEQAVGEDPAGNKPALTFTHRENQYRLSAIWQSRDSGQDVWGS